MNIINVNNTISQSQFDAHKTIHIRLQKRNARKCFTIIQGLDNSKDDTITLLKKLKTKFCCAGYLKDIEEFGEVIQMSGDNRNKIKEFLVTEYNINTADIIIHGYE
jgi:translation initiation factor 1